MLVSPLPFCLPYSLPLSTASLSSFSRPLPFPPPASSCCGLVLRPAVFFLRFLSARGRLLALASLGAGRASTRVAGVPVFSLRREQARYPLAARCLSSARVVALVYWSDWGCVEGKNIIILHNMVSYCTILYHIVQYDIAQYGTILYNMLPYGIILYNMGGVYKGGVYKGGLI